MNIPPAALEAGARAIGEETYVGNKETLRDAARAAFLAIVDAWPGMQHDNYVIVLPLTEKPSDE